MNVIISDHARFEIGHRGLSEEMVTIVAQNPQQVIKTGQGRRICQSKYHDLSQNREMLLRVICEERHDLLFIVTAYRTSKMNKYWVRES